MKRFTVLIVLCILAAGVVRGQNQPLNVVATTTIIADVARNVGGDLVNVTSLVPPNSDVHAFQPAPDDVLRVAKAGVVLVNGAGLEQFLGTLLQNAANVKPVVVSNGIEMLVFGGPDTEILPESDPGEEEAEAQVAGILGDEGVCQNEQIEQHEEGAVATESAERQQGSCDPHVWTDPHNVMIWADNIVTAFGDADPAHAETYRANADAYKAKLGTLDDDVSKILSAVPEDRCILVTNHDFLGYFARAYGFEIVGVVIPSGSTLAEPSPQDLAALVDAIKQQKVPAIFAEFSANPQLAQVVANETGITVVTDLYSGSLSAADGPAATYLDYMRYNAQTIANALGGS